jgi:hypothetical protein
MATERRFCSNCGQPVVSDARFCGSCGSPLNTPPVSAPVLTPTEPNITPIPQSTAPSAVPVFSDSEPVLGAFLASRKTGIFSQEGVHIILTGKRLVCAVFTNEMIKQAAKQEGKSGFLSGMIGAATVGYTYYKHYLSMSPDVALKENPQNFAIDLTRIRKIKLERGRKRSNPGQNKGIIHAADVYEDGKLEIEATGEKYTFSVSDHFNGMAWSALQKAGLA